MNGDDDGDDAGFVFCEEDDNVDTGVQDAAWTTSVLASTMAQLTEENVKKLVSIMTDERFCPSGTPRELPGAPMQKYDVGTLFLTPMD